MKFRIPGKTWCVAAAGALAVVGVGAWMISSSKIGAPTAPKGTVVAGGVGAARGPVGLRPWKEGGQDRALEEEAILRDPTPMFLPTEWNATDRGLQQELRSEPENQFGNYPARLEFADTALGLRFPVIVPSLARPADALALEKPVRPLEGFGEADRISLTVERRQGFLEVTRVGDGHSILTEDLRDARPPSDGSWQPMEFLVGVDAMGLVKSPMLIASSRVAAVDEYFQDFLGKGLHLGERLPPGFYRVAIGP